jgi:hypothetical protein
LVKTPKLHFIDSGIACYLRGTRFVGVEVKSGATVPLESFASLAAAATLIPELEARIVVHGGADSWSNRVGRALPFREMDRFAWTG